MESYELSLFKYYAYITCTLALLIGSIGVILAGIFIPRLKYRYRYFLYGFISLLLFVTVVSSFPGPHGPPEIEFEVKANLHTIRVALDRYASTHDGMYPTDINDLIGVNDFVRYPHNPFTNKEMKDIPFGSEPFEGEFTYIPVIDETRVIGYYVLGYGRKEHEGTDVNGDGIRDHVIMIVSSDDFKETSALPPLEDLL